MTKMASWTMEKTKYGATILILNTKILGVGRKGHLVEVQAGVEEGAEDVVPKM